jgi:hypothetical protein
MYGLTLRGNNCSLGANTGALTAVNAELSVHGGIAVSVFPFGGPGATLTNNRTFAGVLRYTLGGTPINLQENASYGSSCFGLGLTAAGVPTPGGTLLFTTSNPTNQSVGLCLLSTDLVPGFPNGLDLTFLGAPGCLALVDPNAGFATVISNLGAPVPGMSVSLSLPAIPGYLGLPIYAQSVWLDATLNAFGIATSNGVRIRIG